MTMILIVDDDPLMLEIMQLSVEDFGHEVILACGIEEAMAIIDSALPIDALITDIRLMLDADGGYVLARRAIAARPGLRICYASGSEMDPEMAVQFVPHALYLHKPFLGGVLAQILSDLVSGRPPAFEAA
jgi:DNA-binding NtrC family response regulator